MPFNRRRATSNPASRQPPSAAASVAATHAFAKDRGENTTLSSAAAAAALRTHVTSPTPVGDTITKRMVRRGSYSSQGSGSQQPAGLRRQSSSGSMVDRSFRAPSPSRSSPVVEPDRNTPPVPAVPKDVPGVGVIHRRASSLEPPFRGGSPAPRGGGRGASLDRGNMGPTGRGQGRAARVMSLQQVPEDSNSPRSVNFSRPMSPAVGSPAQNVASNRQSGWFVGPVVNKEQTFRGEKVRPKTAGASAQDVRNVEQTVRNAAEKPVSNHRHQLSHGVEGARLATGSMRAKPSGTSIQSHARSVSGPAQPVDPNSPLAVYDPSTRTFIPKQQAMARFRELDEYEEEPVQQHRAPKKAPSPLRQAPLREPSPPPQRVQKQKSRQSQVVHQEPEPVRHHDFVFEEPERPSAREEHAVHDEPSQPQTAATPEPQPAAARPPTPPSGFQTRAGALLARKSSEEYGSADIKPASDANTSRKLDSAPATAVDEEIPEDPTSPKLASNQDSSYPRLGAPVIPTPVNALDGQDRGSVRHDRNSSLSPPRNAHFAPVAVELNGIRHQPPPRSISPAKSALKSSPSVSRRNSSPVASNGLTARAVPSEGSDTMSDDGFKRRKKNVRVSFDEDPVIAGTSAYPEVETPSSVTGINASKWNQASQQQEEDLMKPRPILPSFGSVRDRDRNRHRDSAEVPEKVTETVSSSMSASVGSITEPLETSNDHAVGGILAHDFASKKPTTTETRSANDPLPPEVTSVEGSGYVSDSSSDTPEDAPTQPTTHLESRFQPEPKTLTQPVETTAQPLPEVDHGPVVSSPETAQLPIPAIAVQPASPDPNEKPGFNFQRRSIPGGWDDEETPADDKPDPLSHVESTSIPSTQPTPAIAPTASEALTRDALANLQDDSDTSDDNSSIYSDAYEDLSENEEGGFASIDALVESPILKPASGLLFSKHADTSPVEPPPKSALRNELHESPTQTTAPPGDWDATQQHWNQLTASRKQEKPAERATPLEPANVPVVQQPTPKAKPKQSNAGPERRAHVEPIATVSKSERASQAPQAAQPRKSAMKKPAQPLQPQAEPHMRKTMRGSPASPVSSSSEPHMRKTMRGTNGVPPKGPSGLAASRHSMPPPASKPPRGALQKKHIPASAAAQAAAPKARPQTMSGPVGVKAAAPAPDFGDADDSDASASSFQRERRRPKTSGGDGRYTMRSSMRTGAAPAPTMRATPAPRPMSPPQAISPAPAFRKSLRSPAPSVEQAPPKSSRFSIRSLSPAGRFRSRPSVDDAPPLPKQTFSPKPAKSSPKVTAKAPPKKTPFKSRFGDSSDEEDGDRPRFQSRFADSDDDDDDFELPHGLTPVRGIPRRPGEEDGDSTDLEDEGSDTEPSPALKNIVASEPRMTNGNTGQGSSLAAGSLRDSKHAPAQLPTFEGGKKTKAKRGFFGLGKKKTSDSQQESPVQQVPESNDIPLPPEQRNRPLTPIGEDKSYEAGIDSRPPKPSSRAMPQYQRSASDSWPLPQPPKIGEEVRPSSSDGITRRRGTMRPTLQKRTSSAISQQTANSVIDPVTGKSVSFGKNGKKKKFQSLRRVFGLND